MSETAVTGRPLAEYEPYVELLAHAMANGLALAAEREFLESLDRSAPLHEAMRSHARSAIQWRFAWGIDELKAPVGEAKLPPETRDRLRAFLELSLEGRYEYTARVGDREARIGVDDLRAILDGLRGEGR